MSVSQVVRFCVLKPRDTLLLPMDTCRIATVRGKRGTLSLSSCVKHCPFISGFGELHFFFLHTLCSIIQLCPTLFDLTDYSPCPWDSPGKNTGVHLPNPVIEPAFLRLPALAGRLFTTSNKQSFGLDEISNDIMCVCIFLTFPSKRDRHSRLCVMKEIPDFTRDLIYFSYG